MGGSGTLGIGMSHGDIFAALLAGVPAGTPHAAYRLNNSKELKSRIGRANDVPPVFVFFSQKDTWSETMEPWLDLVHRSKLGIRHAHKAAGNTCHDKRKHQRRSGIFRSSYTGKHKNSGSDNNSDTQQNDIERSQGAVQFRPQSIRLVFLNTFSAKNIQHDSPYIS